MEKLLKILSALVVVMGIIHVGATFSPLIGDKLESLDPGTYNAMLYMSIMCGVLLIVLGGYVVWVMGKIASYPMLTTTLRVAALILLVNGASAIYFMPHNPFAWVTSALCIGISILIITKK